MKTMLDRDDLVFNPPELGCVLCLSALPGGGSRLYDRSPYGNHGSITGATWARTPGGLYCLSFDGVDDYANCGNDASLDLTSAFTLMGWVYWVDPGVAGDPNIISKVSGPGNGNYWMFVRRDTTKIGVAWYETTWRDHWSVGNITAEVWTHVVGIYDGTNVIIYKNGVLDSSQAKIGTGPIVATANVVVGAWDGASQNWKGKIALARIYNRALSGLEVLRICNEEKSLFGVW